MKRASGLAIVLAAACARSAAPAEIPSPRAGADRLGSVFEASWIEEWIGEPLVLCGPAAARATLVRFYTDDCAYCEASLPALEELRRTLGPQGLATLAIYHPKTRRDPLPEEIRARAAAYGYQGPLAVDRSWHALERAWLDHGIERAATSASFLLDATGVVRFVHPGPSFHPGSIAAGAPAEGDPEAVRDWHDLRAAVEALLSR